MTTPRPWQVRVRVLLLVALAVAPVFLLTLYAGREERGRAAARERTAAHRLARRLAAEHQRLIEDTRQLLFVLSLVPTVQAGEGSACARLFADVLARYPGFGNLGLADADGALVATAGDLPASEGPDPELLRAARAGFAVGALRVAGRVPGLAVAHPLPGGRGQRGIVFAVLELSWLEREASLAELPEGTTVTVWDESGRILVRHPDPEGWLGRAAAESGVFRAMRAEGSEGTAEAVGVDGLPRLYGFAPLPGRSESGGLVLAIGIPARVAFAEAQAIQARNLAVLGFVTLLAAGAAWLGGDRLIVSLFGRMEELARRDALTGLANRRRLLEVGEQEVRRARRFSRPLSAIMLDLDRFKRVNDTYGHAVGDEVLREVASRAATSLREVDLAARYGGEEFAVLLPETDLGAAREAAERIRGRVAASPIPTRRGGVPVTVSMGVAVLGGGDELAALLEAADRALYAAKARGRNRVEVAGSPG